MWELDKKLLQGHALSPITAFTGARSVTLLPTVVAGPLPPRSLMAVLQSVQQYKSHEQTVELRREQSAPHQTSGRSGQTALRCHGPWSWPFACCLLLYLIYAIFFRQGGDAAAGAGHGRVVAAILGVRQRALCCRQGGNAAAGAGQDECLPPV